MRNAHKNKLIGYRESGFTLIELMITVAVIGILSAIAYPSYTEYIAKGRRAEAQSMLAEASQWMERYYSQNNTYVIPSATFTASGFAAAPRGSASGAQFYDITVKNDAPIPGGGVAGVDVNVFILTATAVNRMSNDRCPSFTLNHLGIKGGSANCWTR